jgi:hypothetical protein
MDFTPNSKLMDCAWTYDDNMYYDNYHNNGQYFWKRNYKISWVCAKANKTLYWIKCSYSEVGWYGGENP